MKYRQMMVLTLTALFIACSGGGVNQAAGIILGTVTTGLGAGKSLTLVQSIDADTITITANGNYQFHPSYSSSYNVLVSRQPTDQTCALANASGALVYGHTPPVQVTCVNSAITIGGTISGLATGESAQLRNNGTDLLVVSANGSFTFPTPVAAGANYYVTVLSPERCTKANEYGVATASVTNIRITC
jgi:hypothetical protein